jgi:hypothetical protein
VSRFRSSQVLAAHFHANFGIKGLRICAITGGRAFHSMSSSAQGEQGGRHFEALVLLVLK